MGDAHTDIERDSQRYLNYLCYLKEIRDYLKNPIDGSLEKVFRQAQDVDFSHDGQYWIKEVVEEASADFRGVSSTEIRKSIENKISCLLDNDQDEWKLLVNETNSTHIYRDFKNMYIENFLYIPGFHRWLE